MERFDCEECSIYDDAAANHTGDHDVPCPACGRWVDTSPAFAKPIGGSLEPMSAEMLARLASLDE